MRELGRWMIYAGVVLAAIGALVWLPARPGSLPSRLERLQGDIACQGKHGSSYSPAVICIVLSVVLTLFFWQASQFSRRGLAGTWPTVLAISSQDGRGLLAVLWHRENPFHRSN